MKILAISGSLREASYNTALARAARELAPPGVEVELYERLARIPHYDQDLDQPGTAPPLAVRDLRERIEDADALLIVTPEYNGSVPGVLKNAIDWVSARHSGSWLRNKTVAIAGATTGQYGAIWAQQDLRKVLGITGARVIAGELPVSRAQTAFDSVGRLVDPLVEERLRSHIASLVAEAAPTPVAIGVEQDEGPRAAALRLSTVPALD
jgi:chromate reductase, NAD(P)H dehydrogenase (quinone)